MNTVHKITTQERRFIHPIISEPHNDVINIITQQSRLKYELRYDV